MSKSLNEDIRSLLTEACSLEYCPVEFREWATELLATGTTPARPSAIADFRWRDFRVYLAWASKSMGALQRYRCLNHARELLNIIRNIYDDPR